MSGPSSDSPDTVDTANAEQIIAHLATCDPEFVTDLAARVDLDTYVRKIVGHAIRLEAWHDGLLVGLAAFYANDGTTLTGFITHVSVSTAYRGQGVARRLVTQAIAIATERGMRRLDLEVAASNEQARRLYASLEFAEVREADGTTIMSRSLNTGAPR